MQNKTKLSLLFTICATSLYSFSLYNIHFSFEDMGYITALPITFWISLAFLFASSAILWLIPQKILWLTGIQIVLLIIILFLTPVIISGFGAIPNLGPPLDYYGMADSIVQRHEISVAVDQYLNWPGSMIFTAFMENILGSLNPLMITALTPFLFQIILIISLYVIISISFDKKEQNWWAAAAWITILASWNPENKYSAQSYALILLLILLTILILAFKTKGLIHSGYLFLLMPLIFSVTITHFITSLVMIIFIIGLWIIRRSELLSLSIFS
ncbi:MAG: hypothetical protein PHU23_10365, partial [Dehalococcoidales bacterium]|nr:hypothetical protein [Dehalococcoidales bacterium]